MEDKKVYETPKVEVITFGEADVITASSADLDIGDWWS